MYDNKSALPCPGGGVRGEEIGGGEVLEWVSKPCISYNHGVSWIILARCVSGSLCGREIPFVSVPVGESAKNGLVVVATFGNTVMNTGRRNGVETVLNATLIIFGQLSEFLFIHCACAVHKYYSLCEALVE